MKSTGTMICLYELNKSTKWTRLINFGAGGKTREEIFSVTVNSICHDNLHICGCLVYVLEYPLKELIYTIPN